MVEKLTPKKIEQYGYEYLSNAIDHGDAKVNSTRLSLALKNDEIGFSQYQSLVKQLERMYKKVQMGLSDRITINDEKNEEEKKRLEKERHIDMLTGLHTDAEPELDKLIKELNEHPEGPLNSVVVVYLDLNKFKQINDTHGHAAGDKAVLTFVDRLKALIDRGDTIFRLHKAGDEFVVIMPVGKDLTEQEVVKIFQRISNGVSNFDVPDTNISGLSASVGYAKYKEGDTGKTLMDRADKSMYEAKGESKKVVA